MAEEPATEAPKKSEGRGVSWLVRPLLVSALLIALPAFWIFRTIRNTEKPKAAEPPAMTMTPIDPKVEAEREKARQEEMAQAPAESAKPVVEVVSSRAVIDQDGSIRILGTARNNTDQNFYEVEIEFEVNNAQGQIVSTARTKVKNVAAKATVKFEASTFAPLPRGFRVASINAR